MRFQGGRVAFEIDTRRFERGLYGLQLPPPFIRSIFAAFEELYRRDANESPKRQVSHRPTKDGACRSHLCAGNHG
jgi:hypothetical protein